MTYGKRQVLDKVGRVELLGQICHGFHRTRIDIVLFGGLFQKKVIERSVWIDAVPGGEQYEVQKISNTATKIVLLVT